MIKHVKFGKGFKPLFKELNKCYPGKNTKSKHFWTHFYSKTLDLVSKWTMINSNAKLSTFIFHIESINSLPFFNFHDCNFKLSPTWKNLLNLNKFRLKFLSDYATNKSVIFYRKHETTSCFHHLCENVVSVANFRQTILMLLRLYEALLIQVSLRHSVCKNLWPW